MNTVQAAVIPAINQPVELRQFPIPELEKDSASHNDDIRALLEFKAGLSMLINLSIGGGALSIINLIVLLFILAGRLTNASP